VVLDRNRGGAYLSMFIGTAGLFGTFLFLTCYLQQTLGYSPFMTGFAFLPMSGGLIVTARSGGTVGIFVGGAVIAGALLRPGPLDQQGTPSQARGKVATAQATASPARPARPRWPEPVLCGCRREVGVVVLGSRESPGSGDASSPAWRQAWTWPASGQERIGG
jgi:hypothetical protein